MFSPTRVFAFQTLPSDTYRYWAVLVLNNNGSTSYISCAEVELRTTVGGPDVTNPSTFVSVTGGAVFPASNIVDNNNSTYFITGINQVTNQRFSFDLITPTKVVQMGWLKRVGGLADQAPKDFKIQGSSDGATWVDVASFTNSTAWGDTMRFFSW